MSVTVTGTAVRHLPAQPVRRVRHQVRDGVAVIAFSAASSTALALVLLLLFRLAE
ncbi:MAG TPA: hypothetical protein VF049_19185 [Nocardioidaceae bacterium]|jgi:uncharacterized protein YheU (UPF0270 family)